MKVPDISEQKRETSYQMLSRSKLLENLRIRKATYLLIAAAVRSLGDFTLPANGVSLLSAGSFEPRRILNILPSLTRRNFVLRCGRRLEENKIN